MKVDFDMIFRLNAAEKLVAEHCVSDFYMIFHLKAAQHLIAEHSDFSTLTLYGPNSFFRRFSGHNLR